MGAMTVSLSNQMRGFIKSRVESGDYNNESEYIRDLIRKDREKRFAEPKTFLITVSSGFSRSH